MQFEIIITVGIHLTQQVDASVTAANAYGNPISNIVSEW